MSPTASSTTDAASPLAQPDPDHVLEASFRYCRAVTRKQARNFYYGLKLMPGEKRPAMYAVYAWMRTADDLADQPGDASTKIERLEAFRRNTIAAIDPKALPERQAIQPDGDSHRFDLLWPAVRQTIDRFHIPGQYLHAMIDGQLLDQYRNRYETFEQLYDYCYKVASVVGLVCITVWGYRGGPATQKLAEYRGVALQLTNILRDLVEDARRGRVYLPAEELAEFGYDHDSLVQRLLGGGADGSFEQLLGQQVARARHYYELSDSLEKQIDPSCRATCWTMMRIYRRLLDKIATNPRVVLTKSVRLNALEKLGIAWQANRHSKRKPS